MQARKIQGAIALVTGANRGIGRALTEALLARGAKKVYATARDPQALRGLGDARVVRLPLDVTDAEQVAESLGAAGRGAPVRLRGGVSR